MPSVTTAPTGAPSTWRKRAKTQTQKTNNSLGSWLWSKFGSGHKCKTKLLRDHDDETTTIVTANVRRRPVGTLSAVTNQQQANAARREEMGQQTSKLRRQQSFLRQQLLEMKQQSAESLARAQKRINGEMRDSEDEEEEDLYYNCKEDNEVGGATAGVEVDAGRESFGSDPARSRSSSCRRSSTSSRRRSLAEEQQEREDELMAHEVQRDEYSEEADRRMSQATQLYAEAISALDFALRPGRKRHHSDPSPKPLLLGVKRGSPNMPKNAYDVIVNLAKEDRVGNDCDGEKRDAVLAYRSERQDRE
uniref:Uncharacterized protein n=1 Tax=Hyaloperonospora arabidopsidis (strain Emoy2) TaxID=559515 RepID=M4B2R2_HYAAE